MESIITIATVLTMYFNAANDVNSQYLYNSDLEDGVIHKIEVYEQKADGQMCAKMEYRYSYDEQGRLTDFRHTYKYYKNGYNMETSKWDTTLNAYDVPAEVTLYREIAPSVTSVRTFRMNEAKNDMYLTNKMLCMEPLELISDRLMAIK